MVDLCRPALGHHAIPWTTIQRVSLARVSQLRMGVQLFFSFWAVRQSEASLPVISTAHILPLRWPSPRLARVSRSAPALPARSRSSARKYSSPRAPTWLSWPKPMVVSCVINARMALSTKLFRLRPGGEQRGFRGALGMVQPRQDDPLIFPVKLSKRTQPALPPTNSSAEHGQKSQTASRSMRSIKCRD